MELVSKGDDFSIVEIRIIQSLWTTKAPEYIANMIDRPFKDVERKILEMNRVHKVKLYERPSFERKITKKEAKQAERTKREEKGRILTRVIDESQLISVRLDAKTIIKVKPGTDIEALKKKYKK